ETEIRPERDLGAELHRALEIVEPSGRVARAAGGFREREGRGGGVHGVDSALEPGARLAGRAEDVEVEAADLERDRGAAARVGRAFPALGAERCRRLGTTELHEQRVELVEPARLGGIFVAGALEVLERALGIGERTREEPSDGLDRGAA